MKKDNWVVIVFLLTFALSFLFGIISALVSGMNTLLLAIVLLIFILIGILFDMIGVAVLSSEEATFHAKASRKIHGAKNSIQLIKNANRTSSVCCDVIGDICGIVSGTLTAALVTSLWNQPIAAIITTAVVSSLTVGGKAIGKRIAIKKNESIVFFVGKVLNFFSRD